MNQNTNFVTLKRGGFLLCMILLVLNPMISSATLIGYISELEGTSTIIRKLESINIELGMGILDGDIFNTDTASSVEITLLDEHIINVYENSEFHLHRSISGNSKPDEARKLTLLKLLRGKIRSKVKKLKPGDEWKAMTKTCASGVRGTDFSLCYEENSEMSCLAVLEGTVTGVSVDLDVLPDRYFNSSSQKDLISFDQDEVWNDVDDDNTFLSLIGSGPVGVATDGYVGPCPVPEPATFLYVGGFVLFAFLSTVLKNIRRGLGGYISKRDFDR